MLIALILKYIDLSNLKLKTLFTIVSLFFYDILISKLVNSTFKLLHFTYSTLAKN